MSAGTAVFMGTPPAAVPILEALVDVVDVTLVVTRADKPRGRSGRLVPPAVKVWAAEMDLPVAQPASAAELLDVVVASRPDVAVVAAYGRIIRPELLAVPRRGFVNVHYSLLPRWRGASPVVRAILAGDEATGVSLMIMDEGLDTGPVFATSTVPIGQGDTTGSLTEKLAREGAALLASELPGFIAGDVEVRPQDDGAATAAAKVSQEEAHLDPLRHRVRAIDRAVRAFNPSPGAWCLLGEDRFKIWEVDPAAPEDVEPGVVVQSAGTVLLGAADGAVRLVEVQPAGKPRMRAEDWMNGRRGEAAPLR